MLRHFVTKILHLGVNVPHNDMIILYVITRNNDEQIGHGFTQRDVVIPSTEYNNEMLKQVQHDGYVGRIY